VRVSAMLLIHFQKKCQDDMEAKGAGSCGEKGSWS